jgi:hypothetical protein
VQARFGEGDTPHLKRSTVPTLLNVELVVGQEVFGRREYKEDVSQVLIPDLTILQQEGTPRTALCSALVPWLALPGLAMANDVGPVTVRTVQDLENHDATRSRWG